MPVGIKSAVAVDRRSLLSCEHLVCLVCDILLWALYCENEAENNDDNQRSWRSDLQGKFGDTRDKCVRNDKSNCCCLGAMWWTRSLVISSACLPIPSIISPILLLLLPSLQRTRHNTHSFLTFQGEISGRASGGSAYKESAKFNLFH